MSIFAELKRRNVFRVAATYVVTAWLLVEIGNTLEETLNLPEWADTFVAFLLIIGFPVVNEIPRLLRADESWRRMFESWRAVVAAGGARAIDATSCAKPIGPVGRSLECSADLTYHGCAEPFFAEFSFAGPALFKVPASHIQHMLAAMRRSQIPKASGIVQIKPSTRTGMDRNRSRVAAS